MFLNVFRENLENLELQQEVRDKSRQVCVDKSKKKKLLLLASRKYKSSKEATTVHIMPYI